MRLRAKRRVPDIAPSKLTLRLTSATKVKISLEIYSKLYSIWGEREREQLWMDLAWKNGERRGIR